MNKDQHNYIPTQIIRQIFIIFVILILAGLIFIKLLPYLSGMLGAITLYVVMRKWMRYLTDRKKWPKPLAAGVLMFSSFITRSEERRVGKECRSWWSRD